MSKASIVSPWTLLLSPECFGCPLNTSVVPSRLLLSLQCFFCPFKRFCCPLQGFCCPLQRFCCPFKRCCCPFNASFVPLNTYGVTSMLLLSLQRFFCPFKHFCCHLNASVVPLNASDVPLNTSAVASMLLLSLQCFCCPLCRFVWPLNRFSCSALLLPLWALQLVSRALLLPLLHFTAAACLCVYTVHTRITNWSEPTMYTETDAPTWIKTAPRKAGSVSSSLLPLLVATHHHHSPLSCVKVLLVRAQSAKKYVRAHYRITTCAFLCISN